MNRTSTLKRSGELKRGAPMKQTGFKRKPPAMTARPERSPPPLIKPDRFIVATPVTAPAAPVEKTTYVRSKKLREAYRLIPCQHCGREDGTVCCAHANWAVYGKGERIKASDDRGASLCNDCHMEIDQRSHLSGEERREIWEAAHRRTVLLLVAIGQWPKQVPVPALEWTSER